MHARDDRPRHSGPEGPTPVSSIMDAVDEEQVGHVPSALTTVRPW
jgi:hypothetical protein